MKGWELNSIAVRTFLLWLSAFGKIFYWLYCSASWQSTVTYERVERNMDVSYELASLDTEWHIFYDVSVAILMLHVYQWAKVTSLDVMSRKKITY